MRNTLSITTLQNKPCPKIYFKDFIHKGKTAIIIKKFAISNIYAK